MLCQMVLFYILLVLRRSNTDNVNSKTNVIQPSRSLQTPYYSAKSSLVYTGTKTISNKNNVVPLGYEYYPPNDIPLSDENSMGYDYQKPSQDVPDQGYNYEKPSQDVPDQGYNYQKPSQDVPDQGYNYQKPSQDVPDQGYNYQKPSRDVPDQGYNYQKPSQDVPDQGYNYQKPQSDQIPGYNYNHPNQNQFNDAHQSPGYNYDIPPNHKPFDDGYSTTPLYLPEIIINRSTPKHYQTTKHVYVYGPPSFTSTQRPVFQDEVPRPTYVPPAADTPVQDPSGSYLPPVNRPVFQDPPSSTYLPPVFQDEFNPPTPSYLPPRKPQGDIPQIPDSKYLPANDTIVINIPGFSYLPPNDPPQDPVVSYIPPNDLPHSYLPPNDPPQAYLPPNDPPQSYLPPNDPTQTYLPPNDPPQSYLPPNDPPQSYLPPNDPPQSYLPPNDPPQTYLPPNDPPQQYLPPNDPPQSYLPPNDPPVKPSNAYIPPQSTQIPQQDETPRDDRQYLPPAVARGLTSNSLQIQIVNMSCMQTPSRNFFRVTMRTSRPIENTPVLEGFPQRRCVTNRGQTVFGIDLEGDRMSECGVQQCSNGGTKKRAVNLCMRVRFPTTKGLKLPEDVLLTLQCKVQDRISSHTRYLTMNSFEIQGRSAQNAVAAGGRQQDFRTGVALFRRRSGDEQFSDVVRAGSAVPLGEELLLRAHVKQGDGWRFARLGEVTVRRSGGGGGQRPGASVTLLDTRGCRVPRMRRVCPGQQQRLVSDTLSTALTMRAFAFHDAADGDDMVLAVKLVGCLEYADCFPSDQWPCSENDAAVVRSKHRIRRDANNRTTDWQSYLEFKVIMPQSEANSSTYLKNNEMQFSYWVSATIDGVLIMIVVFLVIVLINFYRRLKKENRNEFIYTVPSIR